MGSDELSLAPIGTILAWSPKVDPSSGDLVPLPNGWQLCDGSTITKGPWSGGSTPNLNNAGLFLRGGDQSSVLEVEESMLEDHEHTDGGHSHSCQASSVAEPHSHTYNAWPNKYHYTDSGTPETADDQIETETTSETVVKVSTTCSLSSQNSNIGKVDTSNANA